MSNLFQHLKITENVAKSLYEIASKNLRKLLYYYQYRVIHQT